MTRECYFCDESEALDRHHIVPRRHGGSDDEENLVTVCPTCHRKLETLYDSRFYDEVMDAPESSIEKPDFWQMPVHCEVSFSNGNRTWTYGAAYKFICKYEKEIRRVAGATGEDGLQWYTFQQTASQRGIGLSNDSAKQIFDHLRRCGAIFENPSPVDDSRQKVFQTNRVWYDNVTEHTKPWFTELSAAELEALHGGGRR